jgi:hypothetical protein
VTDYRSPRFDIVRALAENTNNIEVVLEAMLANGLKFIVVTGSVFEANEGVGSWPMRAFKGITADCFAIGACICVSPLGNS